MFPARQRDSHQTDSITSALEELPWLSVCFQAMSEFEALHALGRRSWWDQFLPYKPAPDPLWSPPLGAFEGCSLAATSLQRPTASPVSFKILPRMLSEAPGRLQPPLESAPDRLLSRGPESETWFCHCLPRSVTLPTSSLRVSCTHPISLGIQAGPARPLRPTEAAAPGSRLVPGTLLRPPPCLRRPSSSSGRRDTALDTASWAGPASTAHEGPSTGLWAATPRTANIKAITTAVTELL